jgi:D-serine deaminase-like pyridoxal phosphate-dependent protein
MHAKYQIDSIQDLLSPSLLFFKDHIEGNLKKVLQMVGDPTRLRPHVKTHKCSEIVKLELKHGIHKHKCATIAEAEMLAQSGAPDVLISYPLVGPNLGRLAKLIHNYPQTRFSTLVDHPVSAKAMSDCLSSQKLQVDVLIDLNVGMNRTGISLGDEAMQLYREFAELPGLRPDGFHVYDGHNHQESLDDRKSAVEKLLGPVLEFKAKLEGIGLSVPRVVCGGTPTFPVFCNMNFPGLECSPGTFVLHDNGYGSKYADLSGFTPAALLLSRVISKPGGNRITLDLGYKAVCSDPPAGKRCLVLGVGDFTPVLQNEEHFAIDTPLADQFTPGDVVLAIPNHVCPTVAMHQRAYVIEGGKCVGTWAIDSRDRVITI